MTRPAAAPAPHDVPALLRLAQASTARVERIENEGRAYWVKRPVDAEPRSWHRLQRLGARLVPLPILRPTANEGGPQAARREAARIEAFARAGFHVPEVAASAPGLLVLTDIGPSLASLRRRMPAEAFAAIVAEAAGTLGRLHAAGLSHGRPSFRDFTHDGERIGFLDFEEEPERVMPLASAQARDLWLLFIELARSEMSEACRQSAFDAYRPFLDAERAAALRPLLRLVTGAARPLWPLLRPFAGRDLRAPYEASLFLRKALTKG